VDSSLVNLISVSVALVAVAVAVWQVRTSTERAERALRLPIITEIAREIRSSEFRQNFMYLQNAVLPVPDSGGFESLPEEFREQAYKICFSIIWAFSSHMELLQKTWWWTGLERGSCEHGQP
jgi:hypothetical protein